MAQVAGALERKIMSELWTERDPTRWELFKRDWSEFCWRTIFYGFHAAMVLLLVAAGLIYMYLLGCALA